MRAYRIKRKYLETEKETTIMYCETSDLAENVLMKEWQELEKQTGLKAKVDYKSKGGFEEETIVTIGCWQLIKQEIFIHLDTKKHKNEEKEAEETKRFIRSLISDVSREFVDSLVLDELQFIANEISSANVKVWLLDPDHKNTLGAEEIKQTGFTVNQKKFLEKINEQLKNNGVGTNAKRNGK